MAVRSIRIRKTAFLDWAAVVLVYFTMATGAVFPFSLGEMYFPVHTAVLAALCGVFLINLRNQISFSDILILLYPLAFVLLVGALRSVDAVAAFDKIEGAVIATIVTSFLVCCLIRRLGLYAFLERFVVTSLIVLVLTIVYRELLGLEGRAGRFFLNGPNVFGWLMGLNALICAYFLTIRFDLKYLLLLPAFFAAVLWTGSKGPLIALIVPLVIMYLSQVHRPKAVLIGAIAFYIVGQAVVLLVPDAAIDRLWAISRMFTGRLDSQDFGSVGIREMAWRESWEMFASHPFFGVGLANWEFFSSSTMRYPHNFVLETLAELGIVGGLVVIGVVGILFIGGGNIVRYIVLFTAIALSFSGDLSYLRFILSLPLGAFVAGRLAVPRVATQ